MKKQNKQNGITLIALVITIILLLILAGISISALTGSGLFVRAQKAKEQAKIDQYAEAIELARTEANIDKITNNAQNIDILIRIQEILEKQDLFKKANFSFDSINRILTIITEEGYVFEITDDGQQYIGKSDEINTMPEEITKADLGFEQNPSGWTKDKVIVEIIINNEEYKKYNIQYSFDVTNDNNWIDYLDGGIEVTENKAIYARLTDGKNYTNYVQENVISIDKTNPNDATIELSSTSTDTASSITATVTHSDSESGVNIVSCKWVYNTTSSEIGTDASSYTGGTFSSNGEEIALSTTTVGTYYLHVLTTDNVGNVKETLSNAVTVEKILTGILVQDVEIGDYVAYNATNNYSYTSVTGTGSSHGNGYSSQTFTSSSSTKWRVLSTGTSTGEVVLISEAPIQTDAGQKFYMRGARGYLYAEEELNRICSIYGHGTGANTSKTFTCQNGDTVEGLSTVTLTGSGARSINVDDINNITGYSPTTGSSYTKSIYYPTKTTSNGKSTSAASRTDTDTYYSYTGSSYLTSTEELYKMLFRNTSDLTNISYWLASRSVNYSSGGGYFNARYVDDGGVEDMFLGSGWSSSFDDHPCYYGVRPIVYLKSTVQTSGKDSSGAWTIIDN